jgi:hypothetical protein
LLDIGNQLERGISRMNESRQPPTTLIFAITMVLFLPAASLAQVKVLMSGGFSAAYQELLPQFENTTGITVTTARGASQGDGPTTIGAQLRRGVPADMVIMSRDGLAELFAEGRIVVGTDVDLGRVLLGVGVRAGTPHPDISTIDTFKQSLLRAKAIGPEQFCYLPKDQSVSAAWHHQRLRGEALGRRGGQRSQWRNRNGRSAGK